MTRRRKTSKTNGTRTHANGGTSLHRRVQQMAAAGLVEDQIALRIGGDKNQLRRKYIDSIKQGRAAKRDAQGAQLTKQQLHDREIIERHFSDWYDPEFGHLLLGGARTVEEGIAYWERPRTAFTNGGEFED